MGLIRDVVALFALVASLVFASTWTETTLSRQDFTLNTSDGLSLTLDSGGRVDSLRLDANELLISSGGFRVREFAPTVINRAPNSGFEFGAGSPASWTAEPPHWRWDTSVVHSGTRSAKIVVPPPTDQVSSLLQSTAFPLSPDTAYDFSVWARIEGVGGTYQPAIRVVELDAAGNVLRGESGRWLQHDLDVPQGTADWQRLRTGFRTRSDCRQAYIYANIWNCYGTIWFDDASLTASLGDGSETTIGGAVTEPSPGVLVQRADLGDAGLSFKATYTAASDHIRIDGQIQDVMMKERGLQITFILPMDASGWVWGDDIRQGRVVTDNVRYENTLLLPYGGTFSCYPFSSLSGPSGGLSLAVPMDVPRIQCTSYNRGRGYQITFDLGLSPATAKFGPGRATFSLLLYRYDPAWGFRAAAAKYYAIFPQFFIKRVQREGLWIGGIDPNQIPNVSDFGFAFDQSGDAHLISDTINGIYTFRYTEPWGWWRWFGTDPNKPSYEVRIATLLNDAASGAGTWNGAPITSVAQGVLNTSPLDAAGRYHLDVSDHFWHFWGTGASAGYYQNYPTNPDPDILPPNRALLAWEYEIGRAAARAAQLGLKLDGVYLDSLHVHWAWATLEDYRQDHWAVADQPLVFSYLTKRPTLLGFLSHYDFVDWLWNRAWASDYWLMGNIFYDAYPFFAHRLDVLGSDHQCSSARFGYQSITRCHRVGI
ncbi:MAG: hypothetical protein HY314_00340 [Acidobacteria bacterium]|nr:hypothetical protein [Acidobacteriota bacterium]